MIIANIRTRVHPISSLFLSSYIIANQNAMQPNEIEQKKAIAII